MRDVVSAIISHEQIQYNRVCCFQSLDAVFPKYPFLYHLEITTSVVVPSGGPNKTTSTSI